MNIVGNSAIGFTEGADVYYFDFHKEKKNPVCKSTKAPKLNDNKTYDVLFVNDE